jgi:hypothetical protein
MTNPPRIRMARPRVRTAGTRIAPLARAGARDRGYDSSWDRTVLLFTSTHPFCLGCQAVGVKTATECIDHVEPHLGDRTRFWNKAMWQPACRWHHDSVKKRLEALYMRGEIGVADLWLNSARAVSMTREAGRG